MKLNLNVNFHSALKVIVFILKILAIIVFICGSLWLWFFWPQINAKIYFPYNFDNSIIESEDLSIPKETNSSISSSKSEGLRMLQYYGQLGDSFGILNVLLAFFNLFLLTFTLLRQINIEKSKSDTDRTLLFKDIFTSLVSNKDAMGFYQELISGSFKTNNTINTNKAKEAFYIYAGLLNLACSYYKQGLISSDQFTSFHIFIKEIKANEVTRDLLDNSNFESLKIVKDEVK